MTKADELKFDTHREPVVYCSNDSKVSLGIKDGDGVKITRKGLAVTVDEIQNVSKNIYSGVIRSIDPCRALDQEGVKEGDMMDFQNRHVIVVYSGGCQLE